MAARLLLLSAVALSFACDERNLNSCLFGGGFQLLDLTHAFDARTVYWPNSRRFEFVKQEAGVRADGNWYAANDFCAGEHGGTHLDAPYHFNAAGPRVGDLPLDKLLLPMHVVDVSSLVHDDPHFVLHKHHLDHMLGVFDTSKPSLVLFKFGWSKFYGSPMKYMGSSGDSNGTLNFPGLSAEVAQFIVNSYPSVVGVGVDTASVDPGASTDFLAHRILLQAGLYVLENVKLDMHVPEISCTALVMPMKIARGSGAPLRLAAICPKEAERVYSGRDFS